MTLPAEPVAAEAPPAGRSRVARWLRRLAWAAAVIVVLMALAWGVLPMVLKSQGEQRLSQLLGRQVTIGQVGFKPWSLELTVDKVAIAGLAGEEPLLQLARLYVNVKAASLWKRAPVVESAEIDAPKIHLARLSEGHYDIDDLIAKFTPSPDAKPTSEPARFSLNNLQVRNGSFSFDDKPVGRRHELRQLQLSLPFISNLPSDVELKVQPRLAFDLNGAAFDSGAQATPFAKDRASALQLHIGDGAKEDLDLAPYLGYVPKTLPVRLLRGRVGADLDVAFSLLSDGTPSVALKGLIRANDVALTDAADQPLVGFTKLLVPLADVQPLRGRVHLGAVQLDSAALKVSRDASGQLSVQRLAAAAPASAAPAASAASSPASAPAAAASPPWKIEVDSLALSGAKVDWSDAAVSPAAALRLDDIAITAKGLRWPDPAEVPITLSAALRAQGEGSATAGRLSLEGVANDKQAKLQLAVEQFALPVLAPYVAQFLVPRVEGQLDLKAGLDWAAGDAARLKLSLAEARLAGLRLVNAASPGAKTGAEAFSLKQLSLRDVDVDVPGQQVSVGSLGLQAPLVKLERDRQGRWNAQRWLVAGPATPASAPAPAASAPASSGGWQVRLNDFKLDGGRVGFVDELPKPAAPPAEAVRMQLTALSLNAQGLAWDGRGGAAREVPAAQLQVSATLLHAADAAERNTSAASRIEWRGQLGLQPMLAKGSARIERFPVHAFEPYVDNPLRISLLRALAGYRGEMAVRDTGHGLAASASGEVLVNDLAVLSRPESPQATPDELLSWQSLAVHGLNFAMQPAGRPKVEIAQIDLSDFYSRLIVTEQGRFNLQSVAPAPAAAPADAASAPKPKPEPPASAASAPQGYDLPLDLSVGGIRLNNGKVDFSDHFVKPNYSAALTQLNGSLGAFSSSTREMATLDLRGRAEGTALLEISGKVNPTAQPLALDIHAKATDLELAPLSPYAAKYAGYDIERGKLSMDVSYQIQPDGRLSATNQVVLNQLTFGNKVDSPSATKLPVLLAVALLKDRNGVIDINLPISGSLDDPQFSVIGLIFKVLGNLLVKAITSPFALLGGGGSDDLSTIAFTPGTAQFVESDAAAIDKVAKALTERPALRMTVTGASDLASEREAYQRAALEQRLMSERKREMIRDGAPADAPVAMSAEDRSRLLKQVYSQTKLDNKPRNLIGIAKDIPAAEMEAMLATALPVNGDTMRELALQRGLAVRDALIAKGLPSERLFLAAPKLDAGGDDAKGWKPNVQLTLSTK